MKVKKGEIKGELINKPMLFICDDFLGAQIPTKTGLLPALLTKLRHGNCSIFMLVQDIKGISP